MQLIAFVGDQVRPARRDAPDGGRDRGVVDLDGHRRYRRSSIPGTSGNLEVSAQPVHRHLPAHVGRRSGSRAAVPSPGSTVRARASSAACRCGSVACGGGDVAGHCVDTSFRTRPAAREQLRAGMGHGAEHRVVRLIPGKDLVDSGSGLHRCTVRAVDRSAVVNTSSTGRNIGGNSASLGSAAQSLLAELTVAWVGRTAGPGSDRCLDHLPRNPLC